MKCDICNAPALPKILSGLYICSQCEQKIANFEDELEDLELQPELKPLIGKSAGWITQTLNLPYVYPYEKIIDAADVMQDNLRSAYTLYQIWQGDVTVWLAPGENSICLVTSENKIISKSLF